MKEPTLLDKLEADEVNNEEARQADIRGGRRTESYEKRPGTENTKIIVKDNSNSNKPLAKEDKNDNKHVKHLKEKRSEQKPPPALLILIIRIKSKKQVHLKVRNNI